MKYLRKHFPRRRLICLYIQSLVRYRKTTECILLIPQSCCDNRIHFLDSTSFSGFFGPDFGFKSLFGFDPGSGLWFRNRAEFGTIVVGPFTTLILLSIITFCTKLNSGCYDYSSSNSLLFEPWQQAANSVTPAITIETHNIVSLFDFSEWV